MKIIWYAPVSNFRDFKTPLMEGNFRIRCWHTHKELLRLGHESLIVDDFWKVPNGDALVLMSMGAQEFNLSKRFLAGGGKVFHDYSENIRGIPILEKTKELCTALCCCSKWLQLEEAKVYGTKSKYIPGIWEPTKVRHNYQSDNNPLKVCWCGNGGNAGVVHNLLVPIIKKVGFEYVEISNLPNSTHQWGLDTWQQDMANCDIVIAPHTNLAKGNNKLLSGWSVGLPVIGSDTLEHQGIVHNSVNGFLCATLEDWEKYLNILKDKHERQKLVAESDKILPDYSVEKITGMWLDVLEEK